METKGKTVLVLGGGFGGLVAANELRTQLPPEHRVVVIDRSPTHLVNAPLLWLMVGQREPEALRRDLGALERKGIEVVHGEVTALDPAARTVQADGRVLKGDYLVVALGAELAPETVPGLTEAGHNIYTFEGAKSVRQALTTFKGGKLAVLAVKIPYKCPAAPYEATMLLEAACRERQIRDRVDIDVYAGEPGPMGVAGPAVSAAVRKMVEERGVHYHPDEHITQVDPERHTLSFASGLSATYDLLVYVPPHRVPPALIAAGLAKEGGWVSVDRHTLETSYPGVYAIGDVTGIPLSVGKPLPKAGVFAEGQAQVVAHNIAVAITGEGTSTRFEGLGECYIEMGDGVANYARGNFFAEPAPQVEMFTPSPEWHTAKELWVENWLERWL